MAEQPHPCGPDGQKPLRCLERKVRTRTAALCRWAAGHDIPVVEVAQQIGIARQTLDDWNHLHPTADMTVKALRQLFAIYDPPLVLKTDNGGHFIASEVRDLLAVTNITHLLSPPMTPRYNGAQEASIGSLKTRAMHIAAAKVGPACRWPS
jgi:transposase InsO family protein